MAREFKQAFHVFESRLESLYSVVVDGQRAVHSSIIDLSKAERTPGVTNTARTALGTAMMELPSRNGTFKIDTATEELNMYD
jgi:hypothetical protein